MQVAAKTGSTVLTGVSKKCLTWFSHKPYKLLMIVLHGTINDRYTFSTCRNFRFASYSSLGMLPCSVCNDSHDQCCQELISSWRCLAANSVVRSPHYSNHIKEAPFVASLIRPPRQVGSLINKTT